MDYKRVMTLWQARQEMMDGEYFEALIKAGVCAFALDESGRGTLMHLEGNEPGIGDYYEFSDMLVHFPDNLELGLVKVSLGCADFEIIRVIPHPHQHSLPVG